MVRQYQQFTYKDNYSVVDLSGSPDLEKLSAAYGIDFLRLTNMDKCDETIDAFLKETFGDTYQPPSAKFSNIIHYLWA